MRSPLRISIGEEEILPSGPDPAPEMKKDFMDRYEIYVVNKPQI